MTRPDDTHERVGLRRVDDPYRWLEHSRAPEVIAWLALQQQRTRDALGAVPARERLTDRLRALSEATRVSGPALRTKPDGDLRYFRKVQDPNAEHPHLVMRDGTHGADRTLWPLDDEPNGAALSLDYYHPSPSGARVAIGTSAGGTERSTLRVLDVEHGGVLATGIEGARNSTVAWLPDESGFYYARDWGDAGRCISLHRIGDPPSADAVVFGRDLSPADYPSCSITPSGRWLFVTVYRSFSHSEIYRLDPTTDEHVSVRLCDAPYLYLPTLTDEAVYVVTDEDADRFRLMRLDPERPHRAHWEQLRGEERRVLIGCEAVDDGLLLSYADDGVAHLAWCALDGTALADVALPGDGAMSGWATAPRSPEALVLFESLTSPRTALCLSRGRAQARPCLAPPPTVPLANVTVRRRYATSNDGTEVPYVLVSPSGAPDEPRPTVLYGYGGFGISVTPAFSPAAHALVDNGFNYVQASVRGGGERGRAWHEAGRGVHKQNVFDDFIAVAEHLVSTGVTRRELLGAWGRSNGGLLVAAALTQRPDLFGAAVAQVPLTDMVRYPRFLLGHLWVTEYGSPDDPDALEALLAYSPYHRVRPGARYPAVMLTTADNDTRVHPLHARKMAAALQGASASGRPVLLRSDEGAGHGSGNAQSKSLEELADVLAFFVWQLTPRDPGPHVAGAPANGGDAGVSHNTE